MEDDQVKSLSAVVDLWFSDSFHGSIVARDVDTYNYVHGAVEELKRRLHSAPSTVGASIAQKPLPPAKPAPTTSPEAADKSSPKQEVAVAPAAAAPIKNEPAPH
jgi:hypothetical protein